MLESKIGKLDEKVFDKILVDAFHWLIDTFGDGSNLLNKTNYRKKQSPLKHITFKHDLNLIWSYKPFNLPWYYYGQYAEYNTVGNSILIHCSKKFTLGFALDSLFHEFKHSQQSMSMYQHFRGSYENHPLEKEANDFAAEWVPVYSQKSLLTAEQTVPLST